MKTSVYKIGYVLIQLNMPDDMSLPENMSMFQVGENLAPEAIQMCYNLSFAEDIEAIESQMYAMKVAGLEARRENIHVFQTEQGECRRINFEGHSLPYAITLKKPEGVTQVWFSRACENMLHFDTVFVSALALEKLMIDTGAMIFHSAYMNYNNTAVLFSAPSETGKSTQANLWEKYRGTYTVNGDRSLLIREEDGWYANGWPICGNSRICRNERYPIKAIVMLKQAKENVAYPLKGFQAVREVMEQITINAWDSDFQIKAMDQLDCLLEEIPVYRLECNISEDAVRCLEEVLG